MTRRKPEHGAVPWYLMFAIVTAVGIGFVAYRVLRERRITAAAEAARAPKPAPKPVEPAPQPEPVAEAAEAPTPEETVPVAADDTCDEVECVLNNYEGACCAKWKKPRARPENGETPESLDRAMISAGINSVKARITACGNISTATGKVKVSVKVDPDGTVSSVQVQTTPDQDLGECVGAMVKLARFAATQTGGSFSYPFIF